MVGAVEDVLEAHRHEPERGLVPAGVEADHAGVAAQLERPFRPARRQEPQDGDDPQAHPLEARADREVGLVRLDVVVEEDVEHRLLPDDLGVGGQQRSLDVGERPLPRLERAVRRQRDLDGGDRRLGQGGVVLEDADLLPHPHHGGVGELVALARPLEVEVARPVGRERHVRQRLERHPHEQAQALALGLHERLHRHVAGDVVGRLGGGQGQEQADDGEAPDEEPPGSAPARTGGSRVGGARSRAPARGPHRAGVDGAPAGGLCHGAMIAVGGPSRAGVGGGIARRGASVGRRRKECAIHEVYKYTGDPRPVRHDALGSYGPRAVVRNGAAGSRLGRTRFGPRRASVACLECRRGSARGAGLKHPRAVKEESR